MFIFLSFREDSQNFDSASIHSNQSAILPHRPFKKKRRKDTESKDTGFHHTYVMRMFDRSVDLAQFKETSPLYPICRAWMLNKPVKIETKASLFDNTEDQQQQTSSENKGDMIDELPMPTFLPKDMDTRIPKLRKFQANKKFDHANVILNIC